MRWADNLTTVSTHLSVIAKESRVARGLCAPSKSSRRPDFLIDDPSRRKRGRPRKDIKPGSELADPIARAPQPPVSGATQPPNPSLQQHANLPKLVNAQFDRNAPVKAAPTKHVVKALPTVRDHTTDQLGPEGDEYIPRETDPEGEKKVTPDGRLRETREYKCRTFLVPNRGDKLFMLATECARNLGYRDSYLLFNKNRSLYKIIATQHEKDDLIQQEILPYSYRSRQIAIVTAKSMFRQFGSRLITNGRRVRDDYWEGKARKQGFTEEDLAGEKRPGGAKAAREAQEAANAAAMGHQDIVYTNGPHTIPVDANGHPQLMQAGLGGTMGSSIAPGPLPMIHLPPQEEMRLRNDYNNVTRGPRQEMTGIPYQDRIQPSSQPEIMSQSTQTTEFNKAVNAQSKQRSKQIDDFYKQPRNVDTTGPLQPGPLQPGPESPSVSNQPMQPGQAISGNMMGPGHQPMLTQQPPSMSHPQMYQQQPPPSQHQQQPPPPPPSQHHAASQSPVRNMQPQIQHHPSNLQYSSSAMPQGSGYAFSQQSQLWGQPPPQPHQSPISSHNGVPQYQTPQASHSSPHPSQSPHQHPQPQPQLQHSQPSGSIHGGMAYPSIPNIAAQGAYGAPSSMYRPQQSPSPHAYMQQSTGGTAAGMHTWAPPQQPGHGQSWGSGY